MLIIFEKRRKKQDVKVKNTNPNDTKLILVAKTVSKFQQQK